MSETLVETRSGMPALKEEIVAKTLEAFISKEIAVMLTRRTSGSAEKQAQLMTDAFFFRSAVSFAQAQTKHAPVWMYRWD
ncbi:hypothetical protein [Tumebacillus flagellatus]|uniref:Uncharacterized protein n=1 Tax=Tumebacillus flagellatus TaxID=1157490 RepID=A0A074LL54_9BACL|nr:hypothetical protein [Tumebacillus flagellatus]KEO82866.1 hypothetical protein EL26_13235 [Tumebacillus flagellatus]